MFARVNITEVSPTGINADISFIRETILPQARSMQGSKGSYL